MSDGFGGDTQLCIMKMEKEEDDLSGDTYEIKRLGPSSKP